MSVGSPTAGTWSSSQWRPDNEFETDRRQRPLLLLRHRLDRLVPGHRPVGTKSTRSAASSGSRPPARRRWWGGFSRSHTPLPKPWRDGGHAATPIACSSSTATASPSGAGARRGAPPARRTACRPASSTIAAAPPPATCGYGRANACLALYCATLMAMVRRFMSIRPVTWAPSAMMT